LLLTQHDGDNEAGQTAWVWNHRVPGCGAQKQHDKLEINDHTRTFSPQHKTTRFLTLSLLSNYKYATLCHGEAWKGLIDA
jgi:hypothetical protein